MESDVNATACDQRDETSDVGISDLTVHFQEPVGCVQTGWRAVEVVISYMLYK